MRHIFRELIRYLVASGMISITFTMIRFFILALVSKIPSSSDLILDAKINYLVSIVVTIMVELRGGRS